MGLRSAILAGEVPAEPGDKAVVETPDNMLPLLGSVRTISKISATMSSTGRLAGAMSSGGGSVSNIVVNFGTLRQKRPQGLDRVLAFRDRAMLAILLGCGLRRSEVAALTLKHIQQRDNRWCIVDLVGKHGRVRTILMPTWVKVAIDTWTEPAGITDGHVLRPVKRGDQVDGERMTEKVVWQLLQPYAVAAVAAGVPGIAPHDLRRSCAKMCRAAGGELEQIQLLLGHASVQTTERYLGTKQDLVHAPNDGIKLRVAV